MFFLLIFLIICYSLQNRRIFFAATSLSLLLVFILNMPGTYKILLITLVIMYVDKLHLSIIFEIKFN